MGSVRFFVNGEYHEVDNPVPTTTILEYLRDHKGLTGSKEGCAEGDCGACTVAIAELNDTGFGLRTVNSCIQFLPTVDGKELITVEGLKDSQGHLHPVQQAMVDCHGSQCGFCTPGFVMSLFQLYQHNTAPDREAVNHALAGNLCRCTGYRPIIDAAQKMYEYDSLEDRWQNIPGAVTQTGAAGSEALIQRLKSIQRNNTLAIHNQIEFYAPVTLDALSELRLAHPDATVLAGGTDIGLWVTKQFRHLPKIIYVGDVAELNQIKNTEDGLEIGASVSLTDAFKVLQSEYPKLEEVIRRFASPPICNAGTLVGNVANGSPIGDSMPALMTLDTQVILRSGDSERSLSLDDFYLGYQQKDFKPGEFARAIRIPHQDKAAFVQSYKLSKRYDQDISGVCAAFKLIVHDGVVQDLAICFGGMAAVPKRARYTEQLLRGKPWNEQSLSQANATLAKDFQPISDMRASSDYRQTLTVNLLRKFYLETTQGEEPRVFAVGAGS